MNSSDSYLPANGNSGYRVSNYDLTLDSRPGPGRLSGRAVVRAVATEQLSRFSLDLAGLRVSRVTVNGARPAKYVHGEGKLRIRLPKPIPAGSEFNVEVRYAGTPEPIDTEHWGELGWDQLTDGALVASQPVGAPSWFPCNDQPKDKAAYRFTITAPAPYTVVANGELISTQVGAGSRTWVYEQREPTPSYLATVQIGQYESVRLTESPVRSTLVAPASILPLARNDFARQSEMLDVFGELFGAYPFPGYAVVVTSDELEVPVEAQSVSIFGANHVDGQRGWERLVAHELAHQWFGNSLTVADWRHIWLNEGFAAYAEWLWSEHLWSRNSGGQPASAHAARAHAQLRALPHDLVLADPGVENMFDDRVYKRGPLTLHALRLALGDGAFFTLLRAWARKYRHGSVATEDFIALANEYGDVTDLLHRWLYQPAIPDLG